MSEEIEAEAPLPSRWRKLLVLAVALGTLVEFGILGALLRPRGEPGPVAAPDMPWVASVRDASGAVVHYYARPGSEDRMRALAARHTLGR